MGGSIVLRVEILGELSRNDVQNCVSDSLIFN